MKILATLFAFVFLLTLSACELYTALVELEEVVNTETVLIQALDKYIKAEEQRLEMVRR